MIELSQFFISLHHDVSKDYTAKYKLSTKPETISDPIVETKAEPVIEPFIGLPIEDTSIYKALKEYRLLKCREEDIKAYYIFNNAQLEELCKKMPRTQEALQQISGFDQKRISKYASGILEIINQHR